MERVRITDVSPRDGLQNEQGVIPTMDKVELIRLLCQTGVDEVEVTSFVSPKWVPQLADASEVVRCLWASHALDVTYAEHLQEPSRVGWPTCSPMLSALVPNDRGLDSLVQTASDGRIFFEKASVFTAASETFSQRNTNATIAETLSRFEPVIARCRGLKMLVRAYVSCAIACPFEGAVAPQAVAKVARQLVDLGVDEIDLGDTIGAGTPESVTNMLLAVKDRIGEGWFERNAITLHLHDTFGRAVKCVRAALDVGVRSFDGSVAGLGGCPYASTPGKRAPGNISTELLVKTVHDAGFATGVDMAKLEAAAAFARGIVAKSRVVAGQ